MTGLERLKRDGYRTLRISIDELRRLSEYSASLPTGIAHRKRWLRVDGKFDPDCRASQGLLVGEYEVLKKYPDGRVTYITRFYRPIVVVPAKQERWNA